jgi:hypothetical protein
LEVEGVPDDNAAWELEVEAVPDDNAAWELVQHEVEGVPDAQHGVEVAGGLPAIYHPCPNISPVPIFPNYF